MLTKMNIVKIFQIFFDDPSREFNLREIGRITNLSPAGTSKILKKILSKNIILKKKTNLQDLYRANPVDNEYISLKRALNLYRIQSSGVVEYLKKLYEPDAIILFGSFARGDNNSNSDIDIAVITTESKKYDVSKFEKGHKISIHEINIRQASKEFKNNLVNGITLYGFLRCFDA